MGKAEGNEVTTYHFARIRHYFWNENLDGFFSISGNPLRDSQVRRIINYGIMKGYKTFNDIPENTIKQLLKEPVQLELF